VDAGGMRDRVILYRPVATRESGFNSKQYTWVPVVRDGVWAKVTDAVQDAGTEATANDIRKNVRRRKVVIRWLNAVDTTWRVRINGETVRNAAGDTVPYLFQVVGMAFIGYRDGIELTVEEYRS
jgi:hypothetical protein